MKIYSFLILFLIVSCSNKKIYNEKDMLEIGKKYDPNIEIMIPSELYPRINCSEYGEGCLNGYSVRVHDLILIAVKFSEEDFAKEAARKIQGYYAHNWVFDDVKGEPILEDFVKRYYNAKIADKANFE